MGKEMEEYKVNTKSKKTIVMRTAVAVTVVFFILVAFLATASATDVNVNETGWWRDGGTFNASGTPIQHAIDNATSGDTIEVADGTYTITAAINVNKDVTITGNIANPGNVLVKYNPASSTSNCVEVNSADVTIQGIKVQDCKNGFYFDRNVNTNTGVTISNCSIENVSGWGIGEISSPNTAISHNTITTAGDKGIYFRLCEGTGESNRCEAICNVISGCGQSAIQTFGSKYAYIYDNTISSTNDKGINIIRSGAAGTADRVQVIGNTISKTKWPGIQVIGAPYTYVYDNSLTQCNYYGVDGTGDWDYASIHVQDDGAVSGDNVSIDNNTVSDGINGIQTWSNDVTITNNEVYDMGNTYNDTKVVGSRTYNNSGILVGSNWGSGDIDPTGVVIENNNIHDNYWGLFYSTDLTNGVTAEKNWWGDASGPGGQGPGTGDSISANVDYNPWYNTDALSTKTYYVGSGEDYTTIQSAINAANPGDTIQVADGTYTITSKILVNKVNITITGNVTHPENVVVQYSTNSPIFDMRANDVTVEGIKTISGKSGFYFDQSATGCKILHCIIENATESGISIYNGNTHTIEYTTITNPGQGGNLGYSNGVYTRADSTTIDHCTITSDKVQHMKWGVNLEYGSNHVVTETTITGAWQAAIRAASGVKPVTITNNDIDDATQGYAYEAAISLAGHNDGSAVSGNHIDDVVASCAIAAYNAWNITIANNQIGVDDSINDVRLEGIRAEGLGGSGANRVEITGNIINNTGYAAILLVSDSSNAYIYNNTITKCNNYGADGTGDWDYASIHVNADSGSVIVDNNTVSDGINGIQTWGNDTTITSNEMYDMGLTYADTKTTGDGTYYNSGIIVGTNWLTSNFKPTGTIITKNGIYDNYYGLYVRDYATLSPGDPSVLSVTAENNWWGNASGPYDPSGTIDTPPCNDAPTLDRNADGTGDNVSDNVDYCPWLNAPWGPDLVITKVWVNWTEGEGSDCKICYNVTNVGNGTASSGHNTTLFVDGVEKPYNRVPVELARNATYTGCFNDYTWHYASDGYNITVCADNNGTVGESNETNNCLEDKLLCGDVTGDGWILAGDGSFVYYVAGHVIGTDALSNVWAADVTGDGWILAGDGSFVYYVAGHVIPAGNLNCCCK